MGRTKSRKRKGAGRGRGGRATLEQQVDRALALSQQGKTQQAVEAYRRILRKAPDELSARMNLGLDLARMGHREEGIKHMLRALRLQPSMAPLHADYARAIEDLGMFDEAMAAYRRALELSPQHMEAMVGLGRVQLDTGARKQALATLRQATQVHSMSAVAFCEFARALYDDAAPKPALDAITHAVAVQPDFVYARFHLGVLLDQNGSGQAAEEILASLHPDKKVYRGAVDSWRYVKAHRQAGTRLMSTVQDTLRLAVEHAEGDGLCLEMGVRYGITARMLAAPLGTAKLHGFDSFEGLPEDWHIQPAGTYSTHGNVPELPDNVMLHVGLFADTLPRFIEQHPAPVRLLHVDCDLYSSTATVLAELASRIGPGTVIIFDEYLINDRWREDEYKAFQEAVDKHGWRYDYLAFNLFSGQAVVRIRHQSTPS